MSKPRQYSAEIRERAVRMVRPRPPRPTPRPRLRPETSLPESTRTVPPKSRDSEGFRRRSDTAYNGAMVTENIGIEAMLLFVRLGLLQDATLPLRSAPCGSLESLQPTPRRTSTSKPSPMPGTPPEPGVSFESRAL
jgi:hypothetical protein